MTVDEIMELVKDYSCLHAKCRFGREYEEATKAAALAVRLAIEKLAHELDTQLCAAKYANLRLNAQVERLEKQALNHSWQTNPDRMGGSFSAHEIADANAWR